jgi:hypothetical protein
MQRSMAATFCTLTSSIFKLGVLPSCEEWDILHLGNDEYLPSLIYSPKAAAKGVILAVHGTTPLGPSDMRLRQFCRALCFSGYRVVSPRFDSICRLQVSHAQADDISRAVKAVASDPYHCPAGKIGLLSVSTSGTLSLIAASRKSIQRRLQSILLCGSPVDIYDMLSTICEDDSEPFFRFVLFHNLIEHCIGASPDLKRCLLNMALDCFHKRGIQHQAYMHTLSEREKQELTKLIGSREHRLHRIAEIQSVKPALLEALEPKAAMREIDVPVTFIHSCQNSGRFSYDMAPKNRGARTALPMHGTMRPSIGDLTLFPAIWQICLFLQHIKGKHTLQTLKSLERLPLQAS